MTRSPNAYVFNNPLNATDPMGLGPFDFVGDAWDATGGKAVILGDDHRQNIANTAGGVLNGITLGHDDLFVDESKVDWNSGAPRVGNWVGSALDAPLAIGARQVSRYAVAG